MGWRSLFRASPVDEAARQLYLEAVARARRPEFYTRLEVPDTPDGRFDMIVLHVALILRRMKRDHARTADTAQALFDLMFADMDQNLREMGVGDMSVGKRVKGMARGFYGRLAAYDTALAEDDGAALAATLRRNLFRKTEPSAAAVAAMVGYTRESARQLEARPVGDLLRGEAGFAPPPASQDGSAP